jgi:hypothetical protein
MSCIYIPEPFHCGVKTERREFDTSIGYMSVWSISQARDNRYILANGAAKQNEARHFLEIRSRQKSNQGKARQEPIDYFVRSKGM